MSAGGDLSAADERKYQKLREELTAEVESVQFHQAKIEYLVDQLYAYNRRLTALGGQMLRLAERHRVNRKDFLDRYVGHEGRAIAMNSFGASAPIKKLQEKFGFTVDKVVETAHAVMEALK